MGSAEEATSRVKPAEADEPLDGRGPASETSPSASELVRAKRAQPDAREGPALLHLQRLAGNRAVADLVAKRAGPVVVQRQVLGAGVAPPAADQLPAPVTVTWSGDRFEIGFATSRHAGQSELVFSVRYLGAYKTDGPFVVANTQHISAFIDDRPLNLKVTSSDAASIVVDLYGDGSKAVKLVDRARIDNRPDKHGREHALATVVDQQDTSVVSIWVLDPKASAQDLSPAPAEEHPGENPQSVLDFRTGGVRILLDGDGDEDKELELRLRATQNWPDPVYRDLVKVVAVDAVQRSTGQVRSATLNVAKQAYRGSLFPIVKEVTDGHAPTVIDLVTPSGTVFLKLQPGAHAPTQTSYRLELDGQNADLVFPPDPKPMRRIAAASGVVGAGGVNSSDITLGAYNDRFRVTVRKMSGGKTTLGLSALNGDSPNGTVGLDLKSPDPYGFKVVDTGPTSVGFDLNNDGVADVQLFDQLTTPAEVDGGGPPAKARNHRVRVLGPLVGSERTFDFTYRRGALLGGFAHPGALDVEAARNAEAVGVLAQELAAGGLSDQLDQLEIKMLATRKAAVDRKLFSKAAFDANQALWQLLIRVRAQRKAGVPKQLSTEAVTAAGSFVHELLLDVKSVSMAQMTSASMITGALMAQNWQQAMDSYATTMEWLDKVLHDRLESSGQARAGELQQSEQRRELGHELRDMPAGTIRVAATYHPDEQFRTEQGYVSTVPLQIYVWQDGSDWKLKDVTNPTKPFTYSASADPAQPGPPLALFGKLNDIDHFPAGAINFQVPGGLAGRVAVEDHLTWKKFFTYLGLGLAAAGITLATAGTGTVAVVGAWALAGSAVAGAVAAGIDLGEHIQHDNLTATTAVIDVAQIVAGLAGASALASGRIVVAAGSAPAAARWGGAWADVAMLAQKVYVPATRVAAAADVVTVVAMAESTARQLDEIEQGTADPDQKAQAKRLLLLQLAAMGGLTALSLKGLVGGPGGGRTLVLSPGPDGMPVVSAAVGQKTLIIDSNVAIALEKRTNGVPLQKGEEALLKRFDAVNQGDARIADATIAEAAKKSGRPGPQPGFAVAVPRSSPAYTHLLGELTTANVGAAKGAVDRQIIADAFFAVSEPGVTPTYATMDGGVINKLYTMKVAAEGGTPINKLGKTVAESFPSGFDVTVDGRTLHVLPLPKR